MVRSFLLVLFIVVMGCGQRTDKEVKNKDDDSVVENGTLTLNQKLGELDLPVYNFDDLEPLLYQEDNKIHVINFWATWCAPCVKELPYFEEINAQYENDNVKVLLVNLDMPKMWESHLIPFIKKKKLKSEIVILDDPKQNTWIPKVNETWSGAIPATIIYKAGKRNFYERSFSSDELKSELNTFLN